MRLTMHYFPGHNRLSLRARKITTFTNRGLWKMAAEGTGGVFWGRYYVNHYVIHVASDDSTDVSGHIPYHPVRAC
jgi:hypothetical protein